jgi:outer membrane protein TolC
MSLKSLSIILMMILFTVVTGCQGYKSFSSRNQIGFSKLVELESSEEDSALKLSKKKKSLFSFFDTSRSEQEYLDDKKLYDFLKESDSLGSNDKTEKVKTAESVHEEEAEITLREEEGSQNRLVFHTVDESIQLVTLADGDLPELAADEQVTPVEEPKKFGANSYPIDLPATLRLAGADNWNVRLAIEQINEAYSRHEKAKAMWVPSLNVGIGYSKHEGKIQGTNGQIIDVSRNSLFVGGGAITSSQPPLAGGSGGPARLALDLSLTDTIFAPLAECQLYHASRSKYNAIFNNTLLEASLAYYDLVKAQGDLAIAKKNLANAEELFKLTEGFVKAGKGSRADVSRAAVEVSKRKQVIVKAELSMKMASTNLVRILQINPEEIGTQTILVALEDQLLPVSLIQETTPLDELIVQGHTFRPELSEQASRMEASRIRARAEHWRPFLPNLHMGASGGGFGGGVNDSLNGLDGRGDFDLLAVWQVENLGLGTRARRRQMNSLYHQSVITTNRTYDAVSADISNAWNTVHAQRRQIELAEENIKRASESYDQNIARIRGLAGLPLEGLQALSAVAEARQTYLVAIISYNQAQLNLLRSIGRPPGITE